MHCDYKTRNQARASLFENMAVFYNRQRRDSTIRYYVLAHMWLNIASATENNSAGQKQAAENRDRIARLMTAQQIVEAQELA